MVVAEVAVLATEIILAVVLAAVVVALMELAVMVVRQTQAAEEAVVDIAPVHQALVVLA
jgi:hypothetical protein